MEKSHSSTGGTTNEEISEGSARHVGLTVWPAKEVMTENLLRTFKMV